MIGNQIAGFFSVGAPPVAPSNFESIQTITVGSSSVSSVTFSSIPSTYKHLQIRAFAQTGRGTYGIDEFYVRFNGDTGSNYSAHDITGTGASISATASTSADTTRWGNGSFGTTTGGTFGAGTFDILDYSSTSKYKTARALSGVDLNGTVGGYGGWICFNSGAWYNTSAITSINIRSGNNITQYSSFALYGIAGA